MVLYHAADLLWGTRIRGEAEAAGVAARPVRSVQMLEARLADSPVRGVIVDLDDAETALALVRRVRMPDAPGAGRGVRVAAFGPHVATELFEEARRAGADEVLARGALVRRLGEVLRWLEGGEAGRAATDA